MADITPKLSIAILMAAGGGHSSRLPGSGQ